MLAALHEALALPAAYYSCRAVSHIMHCLHGSPHGAPRLLGGGLLVLDLDSYDLHVISGALQWVETALRACPALHAGVG
jgi:hypothetical protein